MRHSLPSEEDWKKPTSGGSASYSQIKVGSNSTRSPAGSSAVRRGLALVEPLLVHPPRRRSTAILLCLFFGWLGCHRFYVGKRTSGRFYLLTGGVFFLGVLVDLVLILLGYFEDQFGRPLQ